jgi:hypothetical protein
VKVLLCPNDMVAAVQQGGDFGVAVAVGRLGDGGVGL